MIGIISGMLQEAIGHKVSLFQVYDSASCLCEGAGMAGKIIVQ